MTTKSEIIDYLAQNKSFFRERFFIVKIGLFGSFAKDEQTDGSDIDLIVEFEKDTPNLYDIKNDLRAFIRERFSIDVDIAREKYLKSNYRESILKETIYEDPDSFYSDSKTFDAVMMNLRMPTRNLNGTE